jgi:hypothetical protein
MRGDVATGEQCLVSFSDTMDEEIPLEGRFMGCVYPTGVVGPRRQKREQKIKIFDRRCRALVSNGSYLKKKVETHLREETLK